MYINTDDLLGLAHELGASDLHVTVGCAPALRLDGKLLPFDAPEWPVKLSEALSKTGKLVPEDTERLARQIMTEGQYQRFQQVGELDFSYSIPGKYRFRVNVFKQRGSVSFVCRLIYPSIPSLQELGMPEVLTTLAEKPRGLVLVTGPTGSGKSTTLAAMIDLINRKSNYHIITIEDPIEFLHRHNKCVINQREVGADTGSFASALRAAMREDPDVILVGEMRDPETMAIAITAAETGHLVFATLHTSSAAQSIERIIDVFPPHQQRQIMVQLANTIQGIVAQLLIPRIDRPGRVAAVEVMMATPAIRNLIREGKTHQLDSQLQTGARFGMQTIDMSLRSLYLKKIISKEDVLSRANDVETLSKML